MPTVRNRKAIDTTLQEFARILKRFERCTDRLCQLRESAHVPVEAGMQGHVKAQTGLKPAPAEAKLTRDEFDRYRWGRTVAASLAPQFDSAEFARNFRAALPPDLSPGFDSVRLKKILQRLCRADLIELTKPGGGRRPAEDRVRSRPRRDRARG